MTILSATTPVQPYTALHLQSFPTEVYTTATGTEIHPMWSGEGNLSYLIVNPHNRQAILIDPDLEILGSYLLTLAQQGLTLVAAIDTHTHAEHVSAAPELKQLLDIDYLMFESAPSSHVTRHVADNQTLSIAGLTLKFIHTPGHTPNVMSILIENHLFTGDSLFLKSCGRTDFPVSDPGIQFDTLQWLKQLPEETLIHPGHNYDHELSLSLGEAKHLNKRLQFTDRNEFIQFMTMFYQNNDKPDDWEWYATFNAR